MSLGQEKQQEKSLQDKILEVLMEIRSKNKISLTDIASRIGWDYAHFVKVKNGQKEGSKPMLKALELLRDFLEAERTKANLTETLRSFLNAAKTDLGIGQESPPSKLDRQ